MMKPTQNSTHPDRTPVAQEVFTYCTREKTDTWHIVMFHNAGGFVERVKCKACGSEHKYKMSQPAAPKKTSSSPVLIRKADGTTVRQGLGGPAKTSTTSGSKGLEETWFSGLKKWGDKAVGNFSAEILYGVGDVFSHPTFGKGVVQARRDNKIDVLFQAGIKTLPSRKS